MKKLLLLSLLCACGRAPVEPPAPERPPAQPPPAAPVVDRVVEVRVAPTGYCTRSLLGAVRCHGSDKDFTLVEAGAKAFVVRPVDLYDPLLVAACALLDGGQIVCGSSRGQESLTVDGAIAISTGGTSTLCVLDASGAVRCRYYPDPPAQLPSFQRIEAVSDAVDLGSGLGFTCALERSGPVKCWGGDVGVPQVPPSTVAKAIAVGDTHVCATGADGKSTCWTSDGELKLPYDALTHLSAGFAATCGEDDLDRTLCFRGPKEIAINFPPLVQLSAGYWGVCGLDDQSTVFCQPLEAP